MTKDNYKVDIESMVHLVGAVYADYSFKGKKLPL